MHLPRTHMHCHIVRVPMRESGPSHWPAALRLICCAVCRGGCFFVVRLLRDVHWALRCIGMCVLLGGGTTFMGVWWDLQAVCSGFHISAWEHCPLRLPLCLFACIAWQLVTFLSFASVPLRVFRNQVFVPYGLPFLPKWITRHISPDLNSTDHEPFREFSYFCPRQPFRTAEGWRWWGHNRRRQWVTLPNITRVVWNVVLWV